MGRAALLPEAQGAADEHDEEDNTGVRAIAEEQRKPGRKEQKQDDRAFELREQQGKGLGSLAPAQTIGGTGLQPPADIVAGESLW
jgi:hypothetical protein